MKRSSLITMIVVAAVLLLGVGIFAMNRDSDDHADDTSHSSEETQDTTAESTESSEAVQVGEGDENAVAATITYNGSSFSPSEVKVKAGDTIKIENTSNKDVQFDSDPHPVHSDNKELNVEFVSAGSSKTFSVNTKGTWGFHNHLDSSESGTVIVE